MLTKTSVQRAKTLQILFLLLLDNLELESWRHGGCERDDATMEELVSVSTSITNYERAKPHIHSVNTMHAWEADS